MTALSAPIQPAQPSRPRRGATWMRRVGGVAVTMALIVLGLGAGLWLGSPASASVGDIEVHMDGDAPGVFASSTPKKLLDMSALAPGGSVSGHMRVRDASGHDGSSLVDAITLMATPAAYGDKCPLSPVDCLAASHALADQLSFQIVATGSGGAGTLTASLTTLTDNGVVIGDGMVDSDTLDIIVKASLDSSVGNDVQYGSVTFNLALGLTSAQSQSGGGTTDNTGGGSGPAAVAGGGAGTPGAPEVAGENQELPPDNGTNQGAANAGGKDILVLGESKSELPNTGVPVASMLALGGGVLLAGLGLLYAAQRRSRTAA